MTIAWITLTKERSATATASQRADRDRARGQARFLIGDEEELVVSAGESVPLAANVPHGVEALEDTVVLDVFSPVREDWVRGDDAYLRR